MRVITLSHVVQAEYHLKFRKKGFYILLLIN